MILILTTIGLGLLTLFLLWALITSIAWGDFAGILIFGGMLFLAAAWWLPKFTMVPGV